MKAITLCILLIAMALSAMAHHHFILKSNGAFAINFYSHLAKEPGNVLFSPISAHAALSLAYEGAEGTTKDLMATTLYLPDPQKTAESYYHIINDFNTIDNVTISFINRVYVGSKYEFKEEFVATVKDKFLSDVGVIDFTQPEKTAAEINQYVEDKTNHKIKNLVKSDDFQNETGAVLLNTLYFKGEWFASLKKSGNAKFYLENGDKVDAPFMSRHGFYNFKQDDAINAQILQIPFKNTNFSILFALPKEKGKLAELEARFVTDNPPDLLANLKSEHTYVKMPSFKIEKTIDLEKILKKMGLEQLFDVNKCTLSGITKHQNLYVSKAVQKVVIEVDENGCGAAPAAVVTETVDQVDMPALSTFTADHPFLFSLIEKTEGAVNILFSGRVSDPTNHL